MRQRCYSFLLLAGMLLVQACSGSGECDRQLRTLDSLSGAVNSVANELQRTDTLLLQKAMTRFAHYSQFIAQNIHDTIAKEDADQLQHFYAGGKSLEAFSVNRQSILARTKLINSQLGRLGLDLKNGGISGEQALQFISQEKQEAQKLTEGSARQKQVFYSALGEFKGALPRVEQLIRSHNNGQLPSIVKDTISL